MTHVLVADDDKDIRLTIVDMLTHAGYHVQSAGDGRSVLSLLVSSPYHFVVVLDFMMPALDGNGVLHIVAKDRALRDQHRFILITATANTIPADLNELIHQMQSPLIRKPFDNDYLLAQVAKAAATLPA